MTCCKTNELKGIKKYLMQLLITCSLLLTIDIVEAFEVKSNTEIIDIFKNYVNNLRSVAIDFTQIDSNGFSISGKLLILKPHNFRCNYYPPYPLLILGNSNFISIYDYGMESLTRIKSKDNVFSFLLRNEIEWDLDYNIEIKDVGINTFTIGFYHFKSDRYIEILFDQVKKQIVLFKIIEDNLDIILRFHDIKQVREFNKKLFNIQNPEIFGKPKHLDKKLIELEYS